MNYPLANITETRTNMPSLVKQALEKGMVILLKNGKPLWGLLDYQEIESYQSWKANRAEQKAFQEWEKTLPIMEISKESAKSIAEAKKSKSITMTAQQFKKRFQNQ